MEESASAAKAEKDAKEERDRRIRADFKGKLDVNCAQMVLSHSLDETSKVPGWVGVTLLCLLNVCSQVDHFYGVLKSARVDGKDESAEGATPRIPSGQSFGEQEKLRRDGFHATVHAEQLSSAGDSASTIVWCEFIHGVPLTIMCACCYQPLTIMCACCYQPGLS